MTWIVPCVAGCDGPMLTTTASSRSPRSNAGRMGLGRRVPTGASKAASSRPVRHQRLLLRLPVILAQGVTDEALVEQDRAQVGVAAEHDAVHVVALALHES